MVALLLTPGYYLLAPRFPADSTIRRSSTIVPQRVVHRSGSGDEHDGVNKSPRHKPSICIRAPSLRSYVRESTAFGSERPALLLASRLRKNGCLTYSRSVLAVFLS
jgi:hypothetical protein